jgi:hypothetical protein
MTVTVTAPGERGGSENGEDEFGGSNGFTLSAPAATSKRRSQLEMRAKVVWISRPIQSDQGERRESVDSGRMTPVVSVGEEPQRVLAGMAVNRDGGAHNNGNSGYMERVAGADG